MSRMLEQREFLLGDAPSVADFGFMGPMLRHFGQDPTPAEIMRQSAPEIYAWIGRVWNAQAQSSSPSFVGQIPDDCVPMLREVCETHLEQLRANARAYSSGGGRFAMVVQGCGYKNLPVSRYRVACLEVLRQAYASLSDTDQKSVRDLLCYPEAEILWAMDPGFEIRSGYDEEKLAPFNKAINVYDAGVPR